MIRIYGTHPDQNADRIALPNGMYNTGKESSAPFRSYMADRDWVKTTWTGYPDIARIRCFVCGDHFPVTDFLYTKKSGLCIACWEKRQNLPKGCQP